MKKRLFVITLLIALWKVGNLQAQDKTGYMDELYVAEQMPEYKSAKAKMDEYTKLMEAEIKTKRTSFDAKLAEYQKIANDANVPDSVKEAKQKELQELEKQIVDLQKAFREEYQAKSTKELTPIYEKIKKAVDDVSKENGNIFIFRKEAMLFQVEENNVSDLVLKKLNITPTAPVAGRGNLKTANKFGYFDANLVVTQLPAYKTAQSDMQVYSKQLQAEMDKTQKEAQKLYEEMQRPEFANLPEATRKAKEAELQKLAQKFQELQQAYQGKMQERQAKAMEPIYKSLQDKINEVAKEGGYSYIFKIETSLVEPADGNISDTVLKKFGVTPAITNKGN